ncbi:MAG: competence type IV pilus ATPase ComGA [Lactobacillus sp.]|nr:competence type IV pilus ATPase ComGA [Lactobacillus sp.]
MNVKNEINQLLAQVISKGASDLFFLPKKQQYLVLCREKDQLVNIAEYQIQEGVELINYLKFQSQMDIAEHRRPQVGAMSYQEHFLRLSSVGNFQDQESLVLRILYGIDQSKFYFEDDLTRINDLSKRRGLILTSGPTGSGKTTTMYKIAKSFAKHKMVMTIEDPVEIVDQDFLQTQVNLNAGNSYSCLLKSALRHRPDVLIIGEIRDSATAKAAIDAALSGHLVLATVHAKNTFQTITRIEAMGIERTDLLNCLTAVSYQRLIAGKCLMDIASGAGLASAILNPEKRGFNCWQEKLQDLKERGLVTDELYEQYKEG